MNIAGLVLMLLYLAQDIFDWRWDYLQQLQDQGVYKLWSGVAMLAFLLFQWRYSWLVQRITSPKTKMNLLTWHKRAGYVAPAIFYLHSMNTGFGYLFLLSTVYFVNFASAIIFFERTRKLKYTIVFKVHIYLSACILFLVLFHLYVVIYYK